MTHRDGTMKQKLIRLFAALALIMAAFGARAQFTPGQILTASQLNSALATKLPITGGTLTGPLTVPTLAATTSITAPTQATGDSTANAATTQFVSNSILNRLTHVSNNAGLKSITTTILGIFTTIRRDGFSTAGDGGKMDYVWSVSACSLNAGAGDNGSQVQAAGVGCWNWDPSGMKVTPMVFGATGNGTADDTAAVAAALAAQAGKTLYLGNYLYGISSTLTVNANIEGDGGGQGLYTATCTSGIRVLAAGFDAISINAPHLVVNHVCLDVAGGVTSASAGIKSIGAQHSTVIQNSQINGICNAIEISGTGTTQNINSKALNNVIRPVNSSSCSGIWLGGSSNTAATVDTIVQGNEVQCGNSTSAVGMKIDDAGGAYVSQNDFYMCNYGTVIDPGASQQITWMYFFDTVLGDTSGTYALWLAPTGSSGAIKGIQCVDCWASSSNSKGAYIDATTGTINGVHFIGSRFYNNKGDGLDVIAGTNVSVDASTFCGNNASAGSNGDVWLASGVTGIRVRDNNFNGACDGESSASAFGVQLNSNATVTLTGNDFVGITTPVAGSPTGTSVVANNNGLDSTMPTVAAAASITLSNSAPTYYITGSSTSITTISGAWNGRVVRLWPAGSPVVTFATGGNICNAFTPTQNVPIIAWYNQSGSCWLLK